MKKYELYILRHAPAGEPDRERYANDALRPLTAKGRRQMRSIARGMKALGLSFGAIVTSPYVRALATAEIAAQVLKSSSKVTRTRTLEPQADHAAILRQLKALFARHRRVLLVGHEPFLSALVSEVLTGGPGLPLLLKKGGLCKLTLTGISARPRAVLNWLLTPRHLRRLA